jgi:hypothetical protein
MWLRIATRYDIGYLSDPLYAYRMHRSNMHHSTISPSAMTRDHVLTVTKAFDLLPVGAPESVRSLRKDAVQQAWLRSIAVECSSGRPGRALIALADAVSHSPALVVTRPFVAAVGKIAVQMLFGHRGYVALARRWGSQSHTPAATSEHRQAILTPEAPA